MANKQYSIRELSELFQIPASTLRYYEEIGLLKNVKHIKNRRIYTNEHIDRLKGIICFKRTGLPMSKIQKFYQYEEHLSQNIDEIIDMMCKQEKELEEKIISLTNDLNHIRDKVYYYTEVKQAISQGNPQPKWSDIIKG